jgi:hypothetical protein
MSSHGLTVVNGFYFKTWLSYETSSEILSNKGNSPTLLELQANRRAFPHPRPKPKKILSKTLKEHLSLT